MAWQIFSVLVGACCFVAVSLGVSAAEVVTPWKMIGTVGAVFIATAVGAYASSLPSDRR
jgi:hypothetical protein